MKSLIVASAATLLGVAAHATTFEVFAHQNSSSGGVGLATIHLVAGQQFTVSASTNDLWSAGALPRFSDANGLVGNRYATASDDSGQAVGTLIGINFGTWTQDGHSAAYGSLVGELNGQYINLGTSFSGTALSTGTLKLYYWDSNNFDNSGSVLVNVSAVPEPETYALMGVGLLAIASLARRRKAS